MNDKLSIVNYFIVSIFCRIFKFVHSSYTFFRLGILFKIFISPIGEIFTFIGSYTEKAENEAHYASYQTKSQKKDDQYQNQKK